MEKQVLFQRVSYGMMAIATCLALALGDAMVADWADGLDGPLGDLLARGSLIPLAVAVMFLAGAVELNHLLRSKGIESLTGVAYPMVLVLLLSPWLSAAGWLGDGPEDLEGMFWPMIWMAVGMIASGVAIVLRRETTGTLRDLGGTWLIIGYIGLLGSFATQLRCAIAMPLHAGPWLLLMVVLVTKSSDIGAFLVGSAIGKHKLIPAVSPAKSIEGAIGGILFSVLIAVGLFVILPQLDTAALKAMADRTDGGKMGLAIDPLGLRFTFLAIGESAGRWPPLALAIVLGVILSVLGQFGDLLESCFKRDANVKDSGKIIPRFGGILDLLDSLLLALPAGWFFLTVVWGL